MANFFEEKQSLFRRLLILLVALSLMLCTLSVRVSAAVNETSEEVNVVTDDDPDEADETADYSVEPIDPIIMVTNGDVNIRSIPSAQGELLGTLPKDTEVTVIGQVDSETAIATWYQIDYTIDGYDGDCFVSGSYLTPVETEENDSDDSDEEGSGTTSEEETEVPETDETTPSVTSVDGSSTLASTNSGTTASDNVDTGDESDTDVGMIVLIVVCILLAIATIVLLILFAVGKSGPSAGKSKDVDDIKATSYLSTPQVGKLHNQGARSAQQDSFTVSPADAANSMGLMAIVADGMGGLEDGDKVSQKAVETAINTFISNAGEQFEPLMWKMIVETNKAVNKMLGSSKLGKCGSTMVAGLIRQGKFMWFCIGDSRIYLWRDGRLIQLNREHIYRHDLELKAANGNGTIDGAYSAKDSSGLTSFFGMGDLRYVDMPAVPLDILGGDRYILMSDGVYNALTKEELIACIKGSSTAEETAEALGKAVAAKEYSNQDNYTAVVLQV